MAFEPEIAEQVRRLLAAALCCSPSLGRLKGNLSRKETSMKKQKVRRLQLSRETIQQLDNPALRAPAGGMSTQCTFTCCPPPDPSVWETCPC